MRLEVTRKTDLAVRALLELANSQRRMKGPELADRVGSTAGFLSQVLNPLVRQGWFSSEVGPSGGYALSANLGELSVLSVIEAIEGPTDSGRCVLADRACGAERPCALHRPWSLARERLTAELGEFRVAALGAP